MQDVSSEFTTNTAHKKRNIIQKVEIDWDLDDNYDNESHRVLSLSVERSIKEPVGGTHSAQADIILSNNDNKYTPD